MPYVSDAQRKFFNANRTRLTAQGVNVDEWNSSSRGLKLPAKKRPKKPVQKAAQDAVWAQALTAILGQPAGEGEKTAGRTAGYTPLYPVVPEQLVQLCMGSLTAKVAHHDGVSSVLDETPYGSVYTEFPGQGGGRDAEACQTAQGRATETRGPFVVKLAVDAIIRSFGGPLVAATPPARNSAHLKQSAAGGVAGPGPLADSVGMLHNGGMPNPLNTISRGMTMPLKGPTSPAQNPINTYGPLSQAGTIGGGMFGQKMTETGSLKLSAWADRLVRLRRRRDPDGISTQPVDACLRGETPDS